MKKRILISGRGIAGMTAARLLFNQGHQDEISRLMTDQITLTPQQLNFLSE